METGNLKALRERIRRSARESLAVQETFFSGDLGEMETAFQHVVRTLQEGGKILIAGNGGSAADAQHLAAEFVNRYGRDRPALPAVALTTDTSILTSVANDAEFRYVFARQVEALGRKGDLLLAITTSGRSANIVEAVERAREMGITTVVLTGGDGGPAGGAADVAVRVTGTDRTPRIQETLLLVEHLLCEWVEAALFPEPEKTPSPGGEK